MFKDYVFILASWSSPFYSTSSAHYKNQDNAVGIATANGLDDRGVAVRPLNIVQTDHGAHPASYAIDSGNPSPGVKRPGPETDHSPPPSAEVKKTRTYTSTFPYFFMV
jgi:hypothetical protein